jgi:hypothetical protein
MTEQNTYQKAPASLDTKGSTCGCKSGATYSHIGPHKAGGRHGLVPLSLLFLPLHIIVPLIYFIRPLRRHEGMEKSSAHEGISLSGHEEGDLQSDEPAGHLDCHAEGGKLLTTAASSSIGVPNHTRHQEDRQM